MGGAQGLLLCLAILPISLTTKELSVNNVFQEAADNPFVDQSAVHDLIYENVALPQKCELKKAIFCQGEYRMTPNYKKLEVNPLKWKAMSEEQRNLHVKRVFRSGIYHLTIVWYR